MGSCCQGPPIPTELETQLSQNKSSKDDYSPISPKDEYEEKTVAIKKQTSLPYKPRQIVNKQENGIISLPTESVISYSPNAHLEELENIELENKQLKRNIENEEINWNAKYKKLQETLDNQALNYGKEIDLMRKQMVAITVNEENKKSEEKIKSLEDRIKSLQIVHEPHSKPSLTKKTEEKNKKDLNKKDEEIIKLRERCNNLEIELKEEKERNHIMNDDQVISMQNTLHQMHSQHALDKETMQNELKLLKEKDPEFINKIYKQRDEYKIELIKLKKQFKEREHTLNLELEALQHKKIKAEDLADLTNKTDEELREIIEKLRFTNRDLNDQVNEGKVSSEQREKELEEQIIGLNNIIKNLKSENRLNSTRGIAALSALTGGNKKLPKPPKVKVTNKTDAVAALNAALLKKQGKTGERHKDDIKGAISGLLAGKQKESGQGPITDDTKSILGMVDTFTKYNKMKKIGLPMASIKNKMKLDGFNDVQIAKFAGEPPPPLLNGIDLSKHNLKKYEKMKKIGLPDGSIQNKMKMDGIDKKVIATYFGEKLDDDDDEKAVGKPMEAPTPKPDFKKYSKMKKIGMPEVSIKNKMKMDGIDEYWVRDFFDEPQPMIGGGKARPMEAPCPKPDMTKYTKMKKVGLPDVAVKNKMKSDGIHEYWVRDFFGEPQPMIGGDDDDEIEEIMKEPCPKPDFSKYQRMKKIKMPDGSIRNKMKMDGIHEYWICVFWGDPLPKIKKKGGKKKKNKIKRKVKPLHWRKKSECDWNNTIWGNMDNLNIKPITSTILITGELSKSLETAFSNIKPKKKNKGGNKKKKDENKEITLIAPKRAFNMIVGLRQFEKMNINDIKIRNYLLKLDDTKLTIEMLENLSKFIPNNEELDELRNFKGNRDKLARGERFVDNMKCMVDIKMRIDLWRFKIKFRSNVFECESRINQIKSTLDKLKSSPQIASFLNICLIIGNFMNEGTNRGKAKGIKLESIDRFSSLKTADNTMTMLMFIMNHIYSDYNKNNEFTSFPDELFQIVDKSKKIEAKTIRDGIGDMKDSLERIGKRITRTSRNLQQIQATFHKSAGNVIKVLSKLRKNATKLKANNKAKKTKFKLDLSIPSTPTTPNITTSTPATPDTDGGDADTEEMENYKENIKKKRRRKKGKAISFVDELLSDATNHEKKEEEKYSKYRAKKKSEKFLIIDPNYKGQRKIRKTKEREINTDDIDNDGFDFDLFTRGETMIESDTDFNDIQPFRAENVRSIKPNHHKTGTGLRRKKKKMKKVKIRRLKRVGKKDKSLPKLASPVSTKTAKTIQKLRQQKEIDKTTDKTADKTDKKKKKRMSISVGKHSEKQDPNKPPSDKFESIMTGFHTMACNKVEALEKEFENLKIFAGNVAVYFGEHDDLEWEELFKSFIIFFQQINKAKKQNNDLQKKKEKKRKKEERERLKKERMAKKGLKPKNKNKNKNNKTLPVEPVNILEEIKMKNMRGTLTPSKAKNDIIGYEKIETK